MKILVLVKEVPDTYGDRKLNLETGLAQREASESVLDEISERSVELALTYSDNHEDAEVILVSVAPPSASSSIRKGLAMGAARAIHIQDSDLLGADIALTAETIAAAVRREGFDLIIAGNASTDGSSGMIPPYLAELLDVPHATGLNSVVISPDSVTGARAVAKGEQRVSVPLPAVISVTEALPDARLPTFRGIMGAKKKAIDEFSLSDLGVNASDPGWARSIILSICERPSRAAGIKIGDEGDAHEKLADFLVKNRLV